MILQSCCKCKINTTIVTELAKQRKDFKCIYTGTKMRIVLELKILANTVRSLNLVDTYPIILVFYNLIISTNNNT